MALDLSKQRSVRDLSRPGRALQILLDPSHAPATELPSLYHNGQEIESTYGVGQEALAGPASDPARRDPRSRLTANRRADASAQRIPLLSTRGGLRHQGGSRPPLIHPFRPRRASLGQESRCIPPMQDCPYLEDLVQDGTLDERAESGSGRAARNPAEDGSVPDPSSRSPIQRSTLLATRNRALGCLG